LAKLAEQVIPECNQPSLTYRSKSLSELAHQSIASISSQIPAAYLLPGKRFWA
jgi:hypothetical protein